MIHNHFHNVTTQKNGRLQEMPVTYSGFYSHGQQAEDIRPRATVGVFPIFEKASTMEIRKHAVLVVKKSINFINPGQISVIVGDFPLYAQQKKCQWVYPDEVDESKMVSFISLLHMEMTLQECGGKLLAGSGWKRMFSIANIFTPGVATSLLGGKHVKRTRYAYQRPNADADDFFKYKFSANRHHCRIEESFGLEPSLISWVVFQGCLVQDEIQQLARLL